MKIPERLSRTEQLLGTEAVERLMKSRVAVFGVGGVGGYVVEVLARSGVGRLDLFDADIVDVTNLNRQIIALCDNVGMDKVAVASERVRSINPQCEVVCHKMFILPENIDEIDFGAFDYVVDCIDTVSTKIELIRRCHAVNTPILTCMGAANKMDATAFRVTDLSKTKMDPLAKVIRKKLRQDGILHTKVVYSEETPLRPVGAGSAPASNAFVPAAEGIVAGGEVVKDLISLDLT